MKKLIAIGLLLTTVPAYADLPVIDFASLAEWAQSLQKQAQQVQLATSELTQAEATVRGIQDVPRGLIDQVQGLTQIAERNPLQGISGNLSGIFNGPGTGQCANSSNVLTMNQFHTATGGDFMGSWINGGTSITSGLQACTQMVLQATQSKLNDLPALNDQLQACPDVACATAVSGRIQQEVATINAQTMQLQAMLAMGELQKQQADFQVLQKQRADAEAVIAATGGQGNTLPTGGPMTANTTAPMFSAGLGGQ